MKKAYSFETRKDTNETHIFEGNYSIAKVTYEPNLNSICKEKIRNRKERIEEATCLNENEARYRAANIGRSVCGICVSHLYTTDY